jgi:hypothetical protein
MKPCTVPTGFVLNRTGIGQILPLFSCPQISTTLPAGNFISGLKYMTQAVDCP